jgi:hypothetical protein
MEDLAEADRMELEKELGEEMAKARRWKLACFEKTRNRVVKKADTAAASGSKVDTSLSAEDLVQLVNVSVASKYGAELAQFIQVITEEMRGMLDMFKQEMHNALPRQIRAIVQQVSREALGNRVEGSPTAPGPSTANGHANPGMLANFVPANTGANLNLQQPFYQTVAYGYLTGGERPVAWTGARRVIS